jgi:hypothetical protein
MSTLRNVPKPEWPSFLGTVSKALLGKRAEVEVAGLDLGDQIVAEWIPIIGVTYDGKDDLVDVALDSGSHLIRQPRQMAVQETSSGVERIAVIDADGTEHTVRFKTPLLLAAPAPR